MSEELVICIDFPNELSYLIVEDNFVVEAPNAKWAIGENWRKEIKPWFKRKGARIIEMTKINNRSIKCAS